MTQKVLIGALIIYLACSVASILKFMERKQLTIANVLTSLIIPIFLAVFMVDLFGYVYQTDFRSLPLPRKILRSFKFMFIEIQIVPLMHTMLIKSFCSMQAESKPQIISFGFMKSASGKRALEDLREIIFLVR